MAGKKIVKLMVFDLDCTLWPFHVECSYSPPFKMNGDQVVDARGEFITKQIMIESISQNVSYNVVWCLSLFFVILILYQPSNHSLTGSKMSPYSEVLEVLEKWSKKCPIAAASRTHYAEGAEVLLNYFGFNKYITYKEIYPGCKLTHFNSLKKKSNVEFKDMLFFDDENRNIIDVKTLGVECKLIDEDIGVTKKIVDDTVAKRFPDT